MANATHMGSSLVTTVLSVAVAAGVGVAGFSLISGNGGSCALGGCSGDEAAATAMVVSDSADGSACTSSAEAACPLTGATLVADSGEASDCSVEKVEACSTASATLVADSAEAGACSVEKVEACSTASATLVADSAEAGACSVEKAEACGEVCDESKDCSPEDCPLVADAGDGAGVGNG